MMEKEVEKKGVSSKATHVQLHSFTKATTICKPKIGRETTVTNKLSPESSKGQIQHMTMCERSIMWYCTHELFSSSFEMGMTSF